MPRYVIATINSYRKPHTTFEWRDGELSVFFHGGEFEADEESAVELLDKLKSMGKITVELVEGDSNAPEFGYKFAVCTSPVEAAMNDVLGTTPDPASPSIYVTTPTAAQFRAGDTFVIGQLSLAEVTDGALREIKHVTLKHAGIPEELHAIDMIKQ